MNPRLITFLLLSLSLHAWALTREPQPRPLKLSIGGQAQALNLTIQTGGGDATPETATAAAEASLASLETAKLSHSRQANSSAPLPGGREHKLINADNRYREVLAEEPTDISDKPGKAAVQKTVTADLQPTPVDAADNSLAANQSTSSSAIRQNALISAALQNQLASRFEYPWLARKRGWQGEVMLSLEIAGDGSLHNWQVAATSGYPVLDRSALEAARGIDYLPEADRLLDGQQLQLRIPVQYRLLDS